MSKKKLMQIDVELDVFKEIISNQMDVDETPNDILKRLLFQDVAHFEYYEQEQKKTLGKKPTGSRQVLEDGLCLSKTYKGKTYTAVARDGKIIMNKKEYDSPSAAAKAITGNNVNGWMWWKYQTENGEWKVIKDLYE